MLIKDLKGNFISSNSKFIDRDSREKWIGNGIKFDGNQLIRSNLSEVTNWNTATPFSANIIFKPTRIGFYEMILTNWPNSVSGSNAFNIDLRLDGTFWVSFQLTGIEADRVVIPYKINEIIHLSAVYDGSVLKVYRNGAFFNSVVSSRIIGDSNTISIGSTGDKASYSSTAVIYDVKIFKKALTEIEVFELHNNKGKVIPKTAINDTLLDLQFEEKSGTVAYDKSGNSYDAALFNFSDTSLGPNNCHVDYTGQPISS